MAAAATGACVLASAPADWWWPWDQWFNRGGNEQSEPQDTPGTPTPAPSAQPADPPEPGTEPAEEDPENPEPGDEAADGEDDEETDDEESEPDTECEIRTGPVDEEVTEEEFLDAVEACQHAAETGDLPEVQTLQADDRFPASEVALTLPDGSQRTYAAGTTGAQVAASIAPSLAKAAVAATLDGAPWDLQWPIERSGAFAIKTMKDAEGLECEGSDDEDGDSDGDGDERAVAAGDDDEGSTADLVAGAVIAELELEDGLVEEIELLRSTCP